MHISELLPPSNTILTKCSKMNEDGHKRHGMNGNVDVTIKEECPKSNYGAGGRLKFFKDGKFILELERAREGERVSWVSVPRKTFWPPQGTAASTPSYRQESSTSLSVSDDNSSIQSSPWQRDHSWKQTTPRRNLSKGMSFCYRRPKSRRIAPRSKKRRRPYSTAPEPEEKPHVKSETSFSNGDSVCNNNNGKVSRGRPSLLSIVQNLVEKCANSARTPPRSVDAVVSPRKRFLREMEKDKLQVDDGCQKRSRSKTLPVQQAATSSVIKVGSPVRINGTTEEAKSVRSSSYSINSLLADDRVKSEERSLKQEPGNSPNHFPSIAQPHYCSPTTEDRWYSESVDRLRSIELSQAEKRGFQPFPPPHSYLPPYIYPYPLTSYYSSAMYSRNYMVPPVYPTPSVPMTPPRHESPACSWNSNTQRGLDPRDDNVADMPLNLSKHAG